MPFAKALYHITGKPWGETFLPINAVGQHFVLYGSFLCPIKTTLEGAQSVAEGAPVRARERPSSGGTAPLGPRLLPPPVPVPPLSRPVSPRSSPRREPGPTPLRASAARASYGRYPGLAPAPLPPRSPAVRPGPPPAPSRRRGRGRSQPAARDTSRCPGTGLPLSALPSPVPRGARCPARGCPSAALTSAPRRESPRHLAHSMPAEDGRTGGGCQRCPRQDTRGGGW